MVSLTPAFSATAFWSLRKVSQFADIRQIKLGHIAGTFRPSYGGFIGSRQSAVAGQFLDSISPKLLKGRFPERGGNA